jgi:DNA mismatch endonuclease (patch repair protein)
MPEMESVSPIRSRNMAEIRGKDTVPEIAVRRMLHGMGLRFRLHRKDLPGRPDIVLSKHRMVVFVHGCFWHRHEGCPYTTTPKTRQEFWLTKFDANVARDRRNQAELERLGWRVFLVWECELRKPDTLRHRIAEAFQLYCVKPR